MSRTPDKRWRRPRAKGLGDLVHAMAQPIARAIDRVAGTDIEHCGGCAKRRATLNAAFPLTSSHDQADRLEQTPGAPLNGGPGA